MHIHCSIVVSISACHAEDPGSIPGRGVVVGFRLSPWYKMREAMNRISGGNRAHGVVASHPLRMRKALGSNPNVSTLCLELQEKSSAL